MAQGRDGARRRTATGRRLGSIRNLEWTDVDAEAKTIRWRAETDEKGYESVVPAPTTLFDALEAYRVELGVLGPMVFPADTDAKRAMSADQFDRFLRRAEVKAELPPLEGSLWHAYRRMWATSRMAHPLKAVAAAGGWRGVETLVRCYQQPTTEALRAVVGD